MNFRLKGLDTVETIFASTVVGALVLWGVAFIVINPVLTLGLLLLILCFLIVGYITVKTVEWCVEFHDKFKNMF